MLSTEQAVVYLRSLMVRFGMVAEKYILSQCEHIGISQADMKTARERLQVEIIVQFGVTYWRIPKEKNHAD